MTFTLDGVELSSEYDEREDILYLWVDGPKPAATFETTAGHLVRLDPETRELVGVTILDYRERWEGKPIPLEVPQFKQRILELA